ncbi:Ankyrin repeat and SOCS box protein 8-like [Oopsacas minuta]|uniref:Ankyrin repeat and SOCS box protein 8-like n=1 Tax=Oopsacas minuta TaxID=111878 RepID=A0AAV7JR81_9METZ|nr:Ankyrin repeat and SOCS box protein 8-like [Oopsacas minuta]
MAWRLYPPIISLVLNSSTSLRKVEEELKKDNSDINTVDTTSRTALHYCILQEQGTVKSTAYELETIMDDSNKGDCRAARDMAAVQWLRLRNASMDEINAWPRRLAIAYLLLSNGANPNVKDYGGWSILRACVQKGDLLLIQILIHFGADTSCASLTEIAYNRGNILCSVYIDKHSLSLKAQCRGTLRLNGYDHKKLFEMFLPSPMKLFLNYNVLFPGYVKKLIPIRTFTDQDIITNRVRYNDVMSFIESHATEEFYINNIVCESSASLKQDLVMIMHKLYNEDCFKELTYEEPPLRKPRYSMEQVPVERMKKLGLYRDKNLKEQKNNNKTGLCKKQRF